MAMMPIMLNSDVSSIIAAARDVTCSSFVYAPDVATSIDSSSITIDVMANKSLMFFVGLAACFMADCFFKLLILFFC